MIVPQVPPRVIQWRNLAVERVNASEVRPFAQITAMARQRKVFGSVHAPMLPRDNVFNVVSEWTILLPKQAVFTTIIGSETDELPRRGIRHY